jgi:hypothetical protein
MSAEGAAWALGFLGCLASAAAWAFSPSSFAHAWLAALTCFMGWPLGSLALVYIHALTGGDWGYAIRPQLSAGIGTLPLLLPALIPVALLSHALYPWMHPSAAAHLHNGFYLNVPFLSLRAAVYVLAWLALGLKTLGLLREPNAQARLYRWGAPTLILLALSVTFASIDATLSMEPQFKSSVYGLLACSEAVLFALSIAVAGLAWTRAPQEREILHGLGRLLFALLVLWAYLDFMQLLIIWSSDLPDEAGWYLERLTGSWRAIATLVAALHFLVPFFLLLWPQLQRSRRALGSIAVLLILMEIPRAWWIVIPAAGRGPRWVDGATMMALLGLALALATRAYRRRSGRVYSHG